MLMRNVSIVASMPRMAFQRSFEILPLGRGNLQITAFIVGNDLGRLLQADPNIKVDNVWRGVDNVRRGGDSVWRGVDNVWRRRREGISKFGIGSVLAGMGDLSMAP